MLEYRVDYFVMSDQGEPVRPSPTGVTLLVGPNNAGKSQTLEDIRNIIMDSAAQGVAVVGASCTKGGSLEEFRDWVEENVPSFPRDGGKVFVANVVGELAPQAIENIWTYDQMSNIGHLFSYHANAIARLTAGDSQPAVDLTVQAPIQPLQRAYADSSFENELNELSMEAFGLELAVDRFAGGQIHLRMSPPPRPRVEYVQDIPTIESLTPFRELPMLSKQGDGVKSYLGLLLNVLGGNFKVIFIDEPEAFLHPPQAFLLGKVLAERAAEGRQVFIATHSSDVVKGTLDADADVTIVRITREGNANHASILSAGDVKDLWSDSLLRYSNLFDGLFNDAVVLCEGDADCRYYASVLDALSASEEHTLDGRMPQILFTHCGGKSRMASVITALRAADVPVICVGDFDILRQDGEAEKVITALGGEPANYAKLISSVRRTLNSIKLPKQKEQLQNEIFEKLDGLSDEILKHDLAQLKDLLKISSGWDQAKKSGKSALPSGDASRDCKTLLADLKEIGLHIVPVGEVESFIKEIGGHGPAWVAEVHEQGLHRDLTNREAVDFVKGIRDAATGGPAKWTGSTPRDAGT